MLLAVNSSCSWEPSLVEMNAHRGPFGHHSVGIYVHQPTCEASLFKIDGLVVDVLDM